jgi:SET domain-containing protein
MFVIKDPPRELSGYTFEVGRAHGLALGHGSLYNHSYSPNAVYQIFEDDKELRVYARRAICTGEEITINYNGYPNDDSPLWFEVSSR